MVFSSWTSRLTYIFNYIVLVKKLPPWKSTDKKNSSKGKKIQLNTCTKPITQWCKLWPWKQWLEEHLEPMSFKIEWFFHKWCVKIALCYPRDFLPIKCFFLFFKCYFLNPCFQAPQDVPCINEIMHTISFSIGINGVSYAHHIS